MSQENISAIIIGFFLTLPFVLVLLAPMAASCK